MQDIVADTENLPLFDIEIAIDQQIGAQPLPFPGMDKAGSSICLFYLRSMCSKGQTCPFRHVKGDRTVVCKHWLRGLCKKGDDCEFLHEYDMSKMPECYFYSKFGLCSNKECPFLHIDPEKKMKDCPWYDRGFCRHGPHCKNKHVRRVMCTNFLCGFCPDGPKCKFVHPKFELPVMDAAFNASKRVIVTCHFCHESGHKAANCHKLSMSARQEMAMKENTNTGLTGGFSFRPLTDVTCYKCGEKGHYANKCPKGVLAFLSNRNNESSFLSDTPSDTANTTQGGDTSTTNNTQDQSNNPVPME